MNKLNMVLITITMLSLSLAVSETLTAMSLNNELKSSQQQTAQALKAVDSLNTSFYSLDEDFEKVRNGWDVCNLLHDWICGAWNWLYALS